MLSLLVVPLLGIAVTVAIAAVPARRRRAAGVPSGWAWRSAIAEVGLVAGTLPSLLLILFPVGEGRSLRLMPMQDMLRLLNADVAHAVLQIGGNLLVFAAFGALAPVRWRIGLPAMLGLSCLSSTSLEIVQYALGTGQVTTVDDVLLNTAGAGIAALVTRRWWRTRLSAAAGPPGDRDPMPGLRTPR